MLTEKELRESYKVREEGNLLVVVFLATMHERDDSRRQAELVREDIYRILNKDPQKVYKILVDANLSAGFRYMSPEARGIYSQLAKLRQFQKAAVVGKNTFLEVVVNLIMQGSGKAMNFRWFNSLESAKEWLLK